MHIIENPDPKKQLKFLTRAISEWHWAIFPLQKVLRNHDGSRVWCACREALKCPNVGKCPRVKWTRRENHLDLMTLAGWWAMGYRGYGVHLGWSGLMGLDLDPRNFTLESVRTVRAWLREFPTAYKVRTGSDGLHVYGIAENNIDPVLGFVHSSGLHVTKIEEMPGIEICAGQKFFVAPFSPHKSGNFYLPVTDTIFLERVMDVYESAARTV
jgi:hypothetical protein